MNTFSHYKKINEEDTLTVLLMLVYLFSFLFLFYGISTSVSTGGSSIFTPWLQNCLSFQSLFTS